MCRDLLAGAVDDVAGGVRLAGPGAWWPWRAPGELPQLMGLFAAGGLTEDAMRIIAAKVPAERDREVARWHRAVAHPAAAGLVVLARRADAKAERGTRAPEPERLTRFGYRDDGWWELHSLLPADEGALAQKALEAAREAEFDDRKGDRDDRAPVGWSDALGRLAVPGWTAWIRRWPEASPAVSASRPSSTSCQLDNGDPMAHLHLGPALPDGLRRYLLCDAKVRAAIERDGQLVGISPLMPTVDVRLRHQIEERDRGCRFPGCGQTALDPRAPHRAPRRPRPRRCPRNLCVLCPFHHRLHHQGAYRIDGDPSRPDGLRFTDKHAQPIEAPQTDNDQPSSRPREPHPPTTPHPAANNSRPAGSPGTDRAVPGRAQKPGGGR